MKLRKTFVMLLVISSMMVGNFNWVKALPPEIQKQIDDLDPKEELVFQGFGYEHVNHGEEAAYDYLINLSYLVPDVVQVIVDYDGVGSEKYIDELKARGYTDIDYSAAYARLGQGQATTQSNPTPAPAPKTPTPFTVNPLDPAKTMWATQSVNYRNGASTEYGKVGMYERHDEVSVTGVASTGWYQITRDDGSVVYASNKYFTEENPTTQTVYDYNEETGVVETIVVSDENPEVVDAVIEELTKDPEPTVTPTPEPTPTATPEPEKTPEPITEPTTPTEQPVASEPVDKWIYLYGALVAAGIFGVSAFVLKKKKKK